MKLTKELNEALEAVSKEVDSWPAWKRSIDPSDRKKATASTENDKSSIKGPNVTRKAMARAAGA